MPSPHTPEECIRFFTYGKVQKISYLDSQRYFCHIYNHSQKRALRIRHQAKFVSKSQTRTNPISPTKSVHVHSFKPATCPTMLIPFPRSMYVLLDVLSWAVLLQIPLSPQTCVAGDSDGVQTVIMAWSKAGHPVSHSLLSPSPNSFEKRQNPSHYKGYHAVKQNHHHPGALFLTSRDFALL